MGYRLTRRAEDQADQILLDGANKWGIEAARPLQPPHARRLGSLGSQPCASRLPSGAPRPGCAGLSLRLGRRLVQPRDERVGQPRHVVLYRIADDEVEILGMAHDRMPLSREARRLIENAPLTAGSCASRRHLRLLPSDGFPAWHQPPGQPGRSMISVSSLAAIKRRGAERRG